MICLLNINKKFLDEHDYHNLNKTKKRERGKNQKSNALISSRVLYVFSTACLT